jgi:phosphoribosylformylglycinamidine cyclo-ligase
VSETYALAGVDIVAADQAVDRIKSHVRSTYIPGVLGDVGGFGGLFDLAALDLVDPVLVSTTDGVGTKALVASMVGRYDTIGIDAVAMCVDDLICQGAKPLFLLDYLSVGKLDPAMAEALVAGVAEGCRQAGCALIGGEMAEHPGVLEPGEFDLAAFAVGAVSRGQILTGAAVTPGDALIGIASPNLRSNGYSLARRLYFEVAGRSPHDPAWDDADHTVADELLSPSVIYAPAVLALIDAVDVHAVAHITGGGIPGNLVRVLADDTDARVERGSWSQPRVFDELQQIGRIDDDELLRTFNCGLGMIAIVAAADADAAVEHLATLGHQAWLVGHVTARDVASSGPRVHIVRDEPVADVH